MKNRLKTDADMERKMGKKNIESESFEEIMKQLESLVVRLENEKMSLDESISLTEKGLELIRIGNKKLEDVKQRVKVVIERADGEIEEEELPSLMEND